MEVYNIFFPCSQGENAQEMPARDRGWSLSTPLTPVEEAVWWILGETPGFIGVLPKKNDSKVVIKRSKNTNDLQGKVCNAKMVNQAEGLTKALNTSMFPYHGDYAYKKKCYRINKQDVMKYLSTFTLGSFFPGTHINVENMIEKLDRATGHTPSSNKVQAGKLNYKLFLQMQG